MRITGDMLARKWNVIVNQARYHQDGKFYENLKNFPGALFDPDGYVLFKTQQDYVKCSHLSIRVKTNAYRGISRIPGYVRMV